MSERTPRRPPGGAGRTGGGRTGGGRTGAGESGPRAASTGPGGARRTAGSVPATSRTGAAPEDPDGRPAESVDGAVPGARRTRGARTRTGEVGRSTGAAANGGAAGRRRPGAGGWWPLEERSLIPSVLGVPPLAAVGVAAGLTALGVTVDLLRIGTLGAVFTVCYLVGCVLGVAWVRRDALFWPMVVPPLLMAVAVPVVVLLTGTTKAGAGIAERLLVIGAPLINGFPMMAWTTGATLVVGVFRLVTQRIRREPAAARGAGRTSGSPRRS